MRGNPAKTSASSRVPECPARHQLVTVEPAATFLCSKHHSGSDKGGVLPSAAQPHAKRDAPRLVLTLLAQRGLAGLAGVCAAVTGIRGRTTTGITIRRAFQPTKQSLRL